MNADQQQTPVGRVTAWLSREAASFRVEDCRMAVTIRATVFWCIPFLLCACAQQTPRGEHHAGNGSDRPAATEAGLRIVNGINRGTGYIDSVGRQYNLRYIPVTVINDGPVAVQFELAFAREYESPLEPSGERFNVIPMPIEWAMNGAEITERMIEDLTERIDEPTVRHTLAPGDECLFAIGTRYLRSASWAAPLPSVLFVQETAESHRTRDDAGDPGGPAEPGAALGLRLDFNRGKPNESRTIIACGRITRAGR